MFECVCVCVGGGVMDTSFLRTLLMIELTVKHVRCLLADYD